MSQYCNGGLVPRQDRTYLIANALNVSEAWLMGYNVSIERDFLLYNILLVIVCRM